MTSSESKNGSLYYDGSRVVMGMGTEGVYNGISGRNERERSDVDSISGYGSGSYQQSINSVPKYTETPIGSITSTTDANSRPSRSSTSSPSLSNSTDKISSMNKSQINQRDLYGRTLLHLASSAGSTKLVNLLLDNHYIDTTLTDYESGFTALHRALYSGNILSAQAIMLHSRDAIRAKDRNNDTPFELMNSVFLKNDGCLNIPDDTQPLNHISEDDEEDIHIPITLESSRLFMFGSNSNHILGFADPDNRTNPEMVKLNRYEENNKHILPKNRFKPFIIKDVKISKLHTVVLTDDLTNNVYICGIPRGGRLGLGEEKVSTQFTFTKVPGFSNVSIQAAAIGLDHTVLITSTNECYTFGSNRNGQLGYPTGKTKLEPSYSPRKVGGDLKRKRVIGCASSNIHTVVYTKDEIFCWGKNVGQMGFISDISSGGIIAPTGKIIGDAGVTSTSNNTNCIIEPLPRNMLFDIGNNTIEMICATDIATIILLSRRQEVYVFMNSIFFKIQFPVDNNFPQTKNFNSYSSHRQSFIYIVKISSSPNGTICAVDNVGSVYTFSLASHFIHPSSNDTPIRPSTLAKQINVSTIWIARKKHLAVIDAAISDDGSVILCTKAGSVWKSTIKKVRNKKSNRNCDYKFNRVPFITRSKQVKCDGNFGSFAAICEDVNIPSLVIEKTNLSDDLHFIVPFISSDYDRPSMKLKEKACGYRPFEIFDNEYKETKMIPLEHDTELSYVGLKSWLSSATEDGFKLSILDIDCDRGYDMVLKIGKDIIPVHRSILSCRSKPLKGLIDGDVNQIKCSGCDSYMNRSKYDGRDCIDFIGFELATVVALVYYLYTDYSLKPWGDFRKSVPKSILKSKQELTGLKLSLELKNYWVEVYRDEQPFRNLLGDLMKMTNNEKYSDVIILLKDDEKYFAHSYILKVRSGYFSTLFSERWYLNRIYDSNGKQLIDLKHIRLEIFEVLISHIYGDREENIFDNIKGLDTAKQFLRFVLEVMEVADEMLLPKLREICECTIKHFVTVKNVGGLLTEAFNYPGSQLQDSLMYFILQNLECLLENGFLMDLNGEVTSRIEIYLKKHLKQNLNQDMVKLCQSFLDNIFDHNDSIARLTPVCGSNSTYTFISQKVPKLQKIVSSRRNSIGEGEIFELEADGENNSSPLAPAAQTSSPSPWNISKIGSPISVGITTGGNRQSSGGNILPNITSTPTPTPTPSSPWSVVSKTNSPSSSSLGSNRLISTSPPSSSPSLTTTWQTQTPKSRARIPSIPSIPSLPSIPSIPSIPSSSPGQDSSPITRKSISSIDMNNSPTPIPLGIKQPIVKSPPVTRSKLSANRSIFDTSSMTPTVTDIPIKLSQKERKRLNREQQKQKEETSTPTSSSTSSSIPPKPTTTSWNSPFQPSTSPSSPWTTTSSNSNSPLTEVKQNQPSSPSPFAMYANKGKEKKKKPIEAPAFTLNDIIQQEKRDLKQRVEQNSRSLKDIQQEEEFEKWWALESQKAQGINPEEEKESPETKPKQQRKHSKPRNNRRTSNPNSNSSTTSSTNKPSSNPNNRHNNNEQQRRLAVNI